MSDYVDTLVLALGGNALLQPGEKPSFNVQMKNAKKTAQSIAKTLAKEDSFVITHGNGPQSGDEFLRGIFARRRIPQLPLDMIDAETQATIGSMLERAISLEFKKIGSKKRVCTLVTHVLVDRNDPSFREPTKPIGPFYHKSAFVAERRIEKFSYVIEDGMYRRVVASPLPERIVELDGIKRLVNEGFGVICCGGGGIPIFGDWTGAKAVIDKDRTTQLLANSIKAKRMVILTNVDYVYDKYGYDATPIRRISAERIRKMRFETGTMMPKIEACINFVRNGGKSAYIGNLYDLDRILGGKSGTKIA